MGERLWQELLQPGGAWWSRLQGVQQQLLAAYGLPLPSLRLDCDRSLDACAYRFRLAGGQWEQGLLYPGRWFATGEAESVSMLMGEWAQEPVYGLEGRWIPESRAEGARQLGCHLLGPEALWVGHLCDRLESRLHWCLSSQWLEGRLQQLGLRSPGAGFGQALRWMLEERVSIAPLPELVEAYQSVARDNSRRLRAMRLALGPRLTTPWLNEQGQLIHVALSESSARKLRQQLNRSDGPESWFLGLLLAQLQSELHWAQHQYGEAALLVSGNLRRDLFELLPFELRRTPVLAFEEIPPDVEVVAASVVGSRLHPLARPWPRLRWESTSPSENVAGM
jgi:flagellar biosynthesis protein FlhA